MSLSYNGKFMCSRPLFAGGLDLLDQDDKCPQARSGHSCAADESHLYLYGGFNNRLGPNGNTSAVFPELWMYNFAMRIWRQITSPNIPLTAASASLRLWNKKLFLYGGTGFPFGSDMCNKLYICHIDSNFLWEAVDVHSNADSLPLEAYGQGVVCNEGDMYVYGGAIGLYFDPINHLHRLSFSGKVAHWYRLKNEGDYEPIGRYKMEIVLHPSRQRFYIIGGGNLWGSQTLEKLDTYEFSTNTWSSVETHPDGHLFPKGRAAFGCVQRDNVVVICGGRHYDIDNSEALDDIWALDLLNLQWQNLSLKLPITLFFHSMALSPTGKLCVFGGVHNNFRQDSLYEVQLILPKLSELCWGVISKCVKHIGSLNAETLLEIGVPRQFVDRLPKKVCHRVTLSCEPS